jgi:hypothetical protein
MPGRSYDTERIRKFFAGDNRVHRVQNAPHPTQCDPETGRAQVGIAGAENWRILLYILFNNRQIRLRMTPEKLRARRVSRLDRRQFGSEPARLQTRHNRVETAGLFRMKGTGIVFYAAPVC